MVDKMGLIPKEFLDVGKVLDFGAQKYEPRGWEQGKDFNEQSNFSSISRHLVKSQGGVIHDSESGLDHYLHIACRALMAYTLRKRTEEEEPLVPPLIGRNCS